MSTSPDGKVRPQFSKKVRKTSTIKTFVSAASAWRKSVTQTSTATTWAESPSPSDHVYDRPVPETPTEAFVASGNLTIAVQHKLIGGLKTKRKPEGRAEKIAKEPYSLGLILLHQPSDNIRLGTHSPVDIIALHGINGNLFTTWEEQRPGGKLWLRDFLPREFPGARVYTFGYDARLFFSLGKGDIDSFAKSLLDDIKNVRTNREEQRRPIIFIAHSMGGLVVKKALTIAKNDDPVRFGNIREYTSSIFFMATPHRGSDHAATLGAITKVINFPFAGTLINRFTGEIRDDLILGLKKDGPSIKKIATDFKDLTDGTVTFYSFIEMTKTKPLTRRIVDDVSGTMDVAAEDVIYMDGRDHQSIVRFDSEKCPSYQKVLGNLKRAVMEATNPYHTKTALEDESCLQSLAFPTMHNRKHDTSRAHPLTCAWILHHPSFTTWYRSPHGLLWIKGHPGSGKSTLMATLHSHLLSSQTPKMIFLDFFFFNGGENLQKSPLGMFRSLLHQIYTKNVRARELILGAYEEKASAFGSGWKWCISELETLLRNVVREVGKKSEVTLFVDALDEAVDERGEKAAPWLLQFFHGLEEDGVKICVACRPYPMFGRLDADEIFVEEHNIGDMEKFVLDGLQTGVQGWNEQPEIARTRLMDVIVLTSRGVFQWTSQRLPRIIRSLNDGEVSFQEMCSKVAAESSELFDLYQSIFADDVASHLPEKSLHFLQWVCLAQRPLTLTELRYALACDCEDVSPLPKCCEESRAFIESDARMEKLVRSLSGGLAEVRYYGKIIIVQFIHETVNDFVRHRGFEFLASIIGVNVPDMIANGEDRLSRSCINYMKMELVSEATIRWDDNYDHERAPPPFIDYVCKYWYLHSERAERAGVSQESLVQRFEPESSPNAFDAWLRAARRLNREDSRRPGFGSALVHIASSSNLQSVVRKLIQNGVSVNAKDFYDNMPLHLAAREGHEGMASLLLDHGAQIDVKSFSSTPLELAAASGHENIVRLLLNRGADINGDENDGGALQAALRSEKLPLIKMLIENGANIHGVDQGTHNPLHEASSRGFESAARLLIEKGADVNMQGGRYGNPLQAAISAERVPSLVHFLLDQGANIHAQGGEYGNALQAACSYDCITDKDAIVKRLLDLGADVNARGGNYECALQAACYFGSMSVVKMLLGAGADVNAQGGYYGTPLIAAARLGKEEIVRLLLEHRAAIEGQGGVYGNVLQAAVKSGNKELVEFFLLKGVSVNVVGGKYGTALQTAVVYNQLALANLLLDRGADVTIPGPEYGDALKAAVFFNREHLVHVLLEKGAGIGINRNIFTSIYERYTYGEGDPVYRHILQRAAHVGNVRTVKALLDHGAEIDANGGYNGSAVTIAATEGHQEVFELLLERGANVTFLSITGTSTFTSAWKHEKMIRLLMEYCKKKENQHGLDQLGEWVQVWGRNCLRDLQEGRKTTAVNYSKATREHLRLCV